MAKTLLVISTFFLCNLLSAQIFLKANILEQGTNGNFDWTASFTGVNLPPNATYYIFNADTLPYNLGDTLDNCHPSTTVGNVPIPGSYLRLSTSMQTYGPPINYTISSYTPPEPAEATNGSITFTFDTLVPDSLIYAYRYAPGFDWVDYFPTTSDGYSYTFTGISTGSFTLSVNWAGNIAEFVRFRSTGYIGDPNYSNVVDNLIATVTYADDSGNCTGAATITPLNATGAVNYIWSDPSLGNSASYSDLCPGHYLVAMEDAAGNTGTVDFIITDEDSNYYDPSWNNGLYYTDTLDFLFLNCDIDYDFPIDSFYFDQTPLYEIGNALVMEFDLIVYQGVNSFVFSDSVVIPSLQDYVIRIGIYCESFKKIMNAFSGKRIIFGRPAGSLGLSSDISLKPMLVYPNPVIDLLYLDKVLKQGSLIDQFGRVVLQFENTAVLDVTSLPKGIYIIASDEVKVPIKVVKE